MSIQINNLHGNSPAAKSITRLVPRLIRSNGSGSTVGCARPKGIAHLAAAHLAPQTSSSSSSTATIIPLGALIDRNEQVSELVSGNSQVSTTSCWLPVLVVVVLVVVVAASADAEEEEKDDDARGTVSLAHTHSLTYSNTPVAHS